MILMLSFIGVRNLSFPDDRRATGNESLIRAQARDGVFAVSPSCSYIHNTVVYVEMVAHIILVGLIHKINEPGFRKPIP